jgi:hypothetical protein
MDLPLQDVEAAAHVRRQSMLRGEPGEGRINLFDPSGVGSNRCPESVSYFALRSAGKYTSPSFPCQLWIAELQPAPFGCTLGLLNPRLSPGSGG